MTAVLCYTIVMRLAGLYSWATEHSDTAMALQGVISVIPPASVFLHYSRRPNQHCAAI